MAAAMPAYAAQGDMNEITVTSAIPVPSQNVAENSDPSALFKWEIETESTSSSTAPPQPDVTQGTQGSSTSTNTLLAAVNVSVTIQHAACLDFLRIIHGLSIATCAGVGFILIVLCIFIVMPFCIQRYLQVSTQQGISDLEEKR
ncbi:hypothetical protein V8B97DRAFT_1930180 [Scleroderma yunnanense]